MILSPLEQFEVNIIYPLSFLGFFDISITNATIYVFLAFTFFSFFLLLGSWNLFLIPLRYQSLIELIYQFVFDMIKNQASLKGQQFFPLFFLTFGFVLLCNLLGLTIVGFMRQGLQFLTLFVPSGVPMAILPLMILIEIMSYCIRPISLSVRLFANMLAGHTLLHIVAGFGVNLLKINFFFGLLPILLLLAITALEFGIAFLQAYVFVILLSIYLKDSISISH